MTRQAAHLPGDSFEQCADNVGLARVAGQAEDDAAGIASPVRCQEPAEGRYEEYTCGKRKCLGIEAPIACVKHATERTLADDNYWSLFRNMTLLLL